MMIDIILAPSSGVGTVLAILNKNLGRKFISTSPSSPLVESKRRLIVNRTLVGFYPKKALAQSSFYHVEDGLEAPGDIELLEDAV